MIRARHVASVFLIAGLAIGCKPTADIQSPPRPVPAADANASPTVHQHFDDFEDATGSKKTYIDGDEEVFGALQNLVYPYAQAAEGSDSHIALTVIEDNDASGSDGRPGLLRFEINELNGTIDHFGLVYLGNADESQIQIKSWQGRTLSTSNLAGTFVEFRYRSENRTDPANDTGSYNVRIEPEMDDSWPKRIDLGTIHAKPDWQVFAKPLAAGTNLSTFLEMMSSDNPTRFKIVWGQEGPSSNYQPGDALLIDDIRISTHE